MPTRRRFSLTHVIMAVVMITVAVGVIGFEVIRDRKANIDVAKKWAVSGPPCSSLSKADFDAQHLSAPKTFDYDGTTIGRLAGDASCSDVKSGGGKGFATDKVCQFTAPGAITVTSKAGSWFFNPGIGHPASILIHHDVAQCVMDSKFTLQTE